MAELKIVASITLKSEYKDELLKELHTIVDETRKEAGCIAYNLHQDTKNPLKYIILEAWKSQQAIDEHNDSHHFKAFVKAVDGKIEGLTVDIIKQVY